MYEDSIVLMYAYVSSATEKSCLETTKHFMNKIMAHAMNTETSSGGMPGGQVDRAINTAQPRNVMTGLGSFS